MGFVTVQRVRCSGTGKTAPFFWTGAAVSRCLGLWHAMRRSSHATPSLQEPRFADERRSAERFLQQARGRICESQESTECGGGAKFTGVVSAPGLPPREPSGTGNSHRSASMNSPKVQSSSDLGPYRVGLDWLFHRRAPSVQCRTCFSLCSLPPESSFRARTLEAFAGAVPDQVGRWFAPGPRTTSSLDSRHSLTAGDSATAEILL